MSAWVAKGLGWLGAGGGLALLAAGLAPPSALAALRGVVLATVLALSVPARAALLARERSPAAGAGLALAEASLLLLGAAAVAALGGAAWATLAGTASYLALGAAVLAGWTALLGARVGPPLIGAGALLLLALPFYAATPLLPLDELERLSLVLHAPLSVLCGTFGATDVLRSETLYRVFPLAQSFPYSYPEPVRALAALRWALILPWLALGLRALATRIRAGGQRSTPTPALAGAALFLILGAPGEAHAQLFPEPSPATNPIGDLETRVQLGYWLPELRGRVRLDGQGEGNPGSKLSLQRTLDLLPQEVLPTFEVAMVWENAGKVQIQYFETVWKGETQTNRNLVFEEKLITRENLIESTYRYRTIALRGALAMPLADWLTVDIIATTRYVKHEVKVLGLPRPFAGRNSVETVMPGIGLGAEILVWDIISAYGTVQWLDFRTSLFGGEEDRWEFKYREWQAGLRFELVQHAHVMAEWYSLDTQVRDADQDHYTHKLSGVRVMVAILF